MAISSFLARRSALCQNYAIGSDGWTRFYPSANCPDKDGNVWPITDNRYLGSRIIYVSTSDGANTNDGFSPVSDGLGHGPKQTLYDNGGSNGAYRLMRTGFPDWCLFKRGDTFLAGFTALDNPTINIAGGRSRYEPMLFGAYGPNASASNPMGDLTGARPIVTPSSFASTNQIFFAQGTSCGNVVFNSIELYDYRSNPADANTGVIQFSGSITSGTNTITGVTNFGNLANGMKVMGQGTRGLTVSSFNSGAGTITLSGTVNINVSNQKFWAFVSNQPGMSFAGNTGLVYVEDCFFHFTSFGLQVLLGPPSNFTDPAVYDNQTQIIIRRNIFWKPCPPNGSASCIFMGDIPTQQYPTIVEENFFLHGGWRPDVPGTESSGTTHNAYCHDLHNTHVFAGNITAEPSTNGYMQRNGTKAYNNAYIGCTYGANMGTGAITNALTASYNTFIQPSGPKRVWLTATAISNPGDTTITVEGLVCDVNGTYTTQMRIDKTTGCHMTTPDNPGALTSTGSPGGYNLSGALSGNVLTIGNGSGGNNTVKAGTRGNGIQVGDRILIWDSVICNGFNVGTSDGWHAVGPPGTTGNYNYAIGSTTFYVPYDKPLPSWVQVGYGVACEDGKPWGNTTNTTIASISADRRSFTTNNATTVLFQAGDGSEFTAGKIRYGNKILPQSLFVFYDPADAAGSMARYPAIRIGPNNIFANSEAPVDSYPAILKKMTTINSDVSGNYVYKWYNYTKTASQVFDNINGAQPNDTMNTGYSAGSQAFCSNSKSGLPGDADLATVEGYMASLSMTATKEAFYTACAANSRVSWDSRFTANAFNNYIRGIFGVSPLTITYPAYNYNTAS